MINDIKNNYRAGVSTVIFLINYRLGRFLWEKKKLNFFFWILYIPCVLVARTMSFMMGCSVPFSARIGNNVVFKHGFYGIFISGLAEIGDKCTIFHHVTIGSNYGSKKAIGAPCLGRSVLVGAGAKVIGNIKVGDGAVIAAGMVVFSDVPPDGVVKPGVMS